MSFKANQMTIFMTVHIWLQKKRQFLDRKI